MFRALKHDCSIFLFYYFFGLLLFPEYFGNRAICGVRFGVVYHLPHYGYHFYFLVIAQSSFVVPRVPAEIPQFIIRSSRLDHLPPPPSSSSATS